MNTWRDKEREREREKKKREERRRRGDTGIEEIIRQNKENKERKRLQKKKCEGEE